MRAVNAGVEKSNTYFARRTWAGTKSRRAKLTLNRVAIGQSWEGWKLNVESSFQCQMPLMAGDRRMEPPEVSMSLPDSFKGAVDLEKRMVRGFGLPGGVQA